MTDKMSQVTAGVRKLADSVNKLAKKFDSISKKRADAMSIEEFIKQKKNEIQKLQKEIIPYQNVIKRSEKNPSLAESLETREAVRKVGEIYGRIMAGRRAIREAESQKRASKALSSTLKSMR